MASRRKADASLARSSAAEYLTFVAATGDAEQAFEVRYQDENIWLTQKLMAALYDVTVAAISQHLRRVFTDGELVEEAVVKEYLTTATDGKAYRTKHYNLQAIIAVGFKVNNPRAVQFRKWGRHPPTASVGAPTLSRPSPQVHRSPTTRGAASHSTKGRGQRGECNDSRATPAMLRPSIRPAERRRTGASWP